MPEIEAASDRFCAPRLDGLPCALSHSRFSKELQVSCQELQSKLRTASLPGVVIEKEIDTILEEGISGSLRLVSARTTKFQRLIDAPNSLPGMQLRPGTPRAKSPESKAKPATAYGVAAGSFRKSSSPTRASSSDAPNGF